MSEPATAPEEAKAPPLPAEASGKAAPRRAWRLKLSHKVGLGGLLVAAVLLLLVSVGVRYGARTETGLATMTRLVDGRPLGRFGRLRVERLGGDPFHRFTVGRLAIEDAQGAWIEARDVTVLWRPLELFARRVHAASVTAKTLTVLRQPRLGPDAGKPGGRSPVSIRIDKLAVRLETLPAFSQRRGLWDVTADLRVARNQSSQGQVDAKSLLHAGDGLGMTFRFGPRGRMFLRARADEGAGGALAGSFGLDANQRMTVRAEVNGADAGGNLSVVTQSGSVQPVVARGRWYKGGASLDLHAVLGASRLADEYAERLGPVVDARLNSRLIRGDLYQVELEATAQYGRGTFSGPVDWKKRTASNGVLDVSVADISKWASAVHARDSHARGQFSFDGSDWSFSGPAEVRRLDQLGYQLDRASGPLELAYSRGELTIKAGLVGTGGKGQTLVAALMGPQPKAETDAVRLKDGRILIRRLDVRGAGVTIQAEGDRSLLGGINMKGTATATDLGLIRPGAKGTVGGAVTVNELRDRPWKVDFDARGAGFATGFGEFDRLLGAQPTIKGSLTWDDELWTFQQVAVAGEALQINGRGTYKQEPGLGLDLDWKAAGPFAAGPVQVVGEVFGRGRATGPLDGPHLDLDADLASIDFGRLVVKPAKLVLSVDAAAAGPAGRVSLAGQSNYGAAKAEAGFRVTERGLTLENLLADAGGVKAQGGFVLSDGAPSTADLTLTAGPGAFLTGGRLEASVKVVDRAGGAATRISLQGNDLAAPELPMTLRSVRLDADGPWSRLPFNLTAEAGGLLPWRFAGQGTLAQAADRRELSLTGGGRVRRANLRFSEPAELRMTPDGLTVKAALTGAGGTAQLDARQAGEVVDARLTVRQVDLSPFAQEYVGRLNADLALSGRGDALSGSFETGIEGGRSRDAPADVALTAKVKATLQGDRVTLDAGATNPQGLTSSLNLVMPAEASAKPFRVALVRNRPLSGAFSADGEIRPLWDLVAGSARSLSGHVTMQGRVGGDLADPRLVGQAMMAKGRFQDNGTGFVLQDIALDTRFDGAAVEIAQASGTDGKEGTVSASGRMDLAPNGASSLTLDLKKFQLIQNDIARATASGRVVAARGADGKTALTGQLAVDRADVNPKPPPPTGVVAMDVVEINRPQADGFEEPTQRLSGPIATLDIQIAAARGVFVRGNGLDLELSLDAHVGGTTAAPVLGGVARVVRGDYDFAGKRFEFDNRGTIRLASRAEQVRLDLSATREDPTLTAVVTIQGTAARPIIGLTSNPVLPQDEVLAQVLFGRSAAQLSSLETAQLAAAVASLATGGGFDVLGGLRQFARLDRLSLAGGGVEGTAVSGGKYITDDVYLELTGGGRAGPSAQVEWRVRRNFAIVSTVGGQEDAKLSVQFRKNY